MLWYSWPLTLTVMALGVLLIAASLPFGNRIAEQERKVSEKNAGFLSMVKDLLSHRLSDEIVPEPSVQQPYPHRQQQEGHSRSVKHKL